MKNVLRSLAFAAILLGTTAANAETENTLTFRDTLVIRANPTLIMNVLNLSLGFQTLTDGDEPNDSSVSLLTAISPTFAKVGPNYTLKLAQFVSVAASLEYVNFFGAGIDLQSFNAPGVDFSDATRSTRKDQGLNVGANALQSTLNLTLRTNLGPLALRSDTRLTHHLASIENDDSYFYDPVLDVLVENGFITLQNDIDALYVTKSGFIAGLRYTVTHPFYTGDVVNSNGPTQRVGPLVSYIFYNKPGATIDSATLFGLANWWVSHRYRAGDQSSQAFPMIAGGLNLTGNFF